MHRIYTTGDEKDAERLVALLRSAGMRAQIGGDDPKANARLARVFRDSVHVWVRTPDERVRARRVMQQHGFVDTPHAKPVEAPSHARTRWLVVALIALAVTIAAGLAF
jgi:hypothetical protein